MHRSVVISNGNRILNPVGIFANSNYLDINLLAIYKNSAYFRCMKLTAKNMCTVFISVRCAALEDEIIQKELSKLVKYAYFDNF